MLSIFYGIGNGRGDGKNTFSFLSVPLKLLLSSPLPAAQAKKIKKFFLFSIDILFSMVYSVTIRAREKTKQKTERAGEQQALGLACNDIEQGGYALPPKDTGGCQPGTTHGRQRIKK